MTASDPPSAGAAVAAARPLVSLGTIFLVFFQVGAMSFGGGLSGWIFRDVVLRRRWMTEDEFLAGHGLSRMLPGMNISNLTIYIGSRMHGVSGAAVALAALLVVPFFSVIGLLALYGRVAQRAALQTALDGIAAAAVGLMLVMAWRAGRRAAGSVAGILVVVAIFVMVGLLQWPLIPVALCVTPISVAAAWPRGA